MSDYSWAETYDPIYAAQKTVIDQNVLPYHRVPNFEGTPTQFYDEQGLRGILTSDGKVYDVSSFNPIVTEGQKITGETPIQSVDPEGNLVFLRDPNDPESVTTQKTPYPLAGGTLADQAYMRPIRRGGGGIFGTILGDFSSAVKDPYFRNFALAAGAMAGAAALAPSLGTAGGTGISGSTAGGFLGGAGEILPGAVGTGGGSLGAAGTDIVGSTAGGFLGGAGEILPGAVGTGGGSLGAPGFFSGLGDFIGGITPAQALQAARFALPVVGALTGGAGGVGGTGGGAGGTGGLGGGSGGNQTVAVNTQGPWNTFLNPTMTKQEVTGQAPVIGTPQLAMLDFEPQLANQLAQSGAIPSNLAGSNVPSVNYYNYGSPPQTDYFAQSDFSPLMAAKGGKIQKPQGLAMGGMPMAQETDEHIPEFITGATGHYVKGRGDGQSDDIPAMLADGEYVFDAETVAQLGNGSSDAGAKFLDKFRHAIREHKRSAPVDKIPPKASPLQYVKEAMKRT